MLSTQVSVACRSLPGGRLKHLNDLDLRVGRTAAAAVPSRRCRRHCRRRRPRPERSPRLVLPHALRTHCLPRVSDAPSREAATACHQDKPCFPALCRDLKSPNRWWTGSGPSRRGTQQAAAHPLNKLPAWPCRTHRHRCAGPLARPKWVLLLPFTGHRIWPEQLPGRVHGAGRRQQRQQPGGHRSRWLAPELWWAKSPRWPIGVCIRC